MVEADLRNAAEIVRDRFYFTSCRSLPANTPTLSFFCIDNELVYEPFYADFGPLNMGCTYQYVQIVKQQLQSNSGKKVVHYCSVDGHKRANAAVLVGAYMVLEMGMSAEDAWRPIKGAYLPFRDASYGVCTFNLTVVDCLRALERGRDFGWIDFAKFDCTEYQHYERVENGDLNVLIPNKFVAFSGPSAVKQEIGDGIYTMVPSDYIDIFRKKGVTAIVRLNKKVYDRRQFTDAGFRHYELYFVDGGTPTDAIIRKFLEIAESEGTVAVHCKAGLGRTGTLIGLYMMKHHRMTASEVIAYLRLMRPGSVIGPQQFFLKEYEARMWKAGETFRRKISAAEGGEAPPRQSDVTLLSTNLRSIDLSSSSSALLARAGSTQGASPNLSPLRGISRGRLTAAGATQGGGSGRAMSNSPLRSSFSAMPRQSREPEPLAVSMSSPLRQSRIGGVGGSRLASLLGRSALGPSSSSPNNSMNGGGNRRYDDESPLSPIHRSNVNSNGYSTSISPPRERKVLGRDRY